MTGIASNRIRAVVSLEWTLIADQRLVRMRNDGSSMRAISRAFGLSRTSVTERAKRLGLEIPPRPQPAPKAVAIASDAGRDPLPAGHPLSWGLLTQGTILEGSPYTPPQAYRGRRTAQGTGA